MNKAILVGRLTADPELKSTTSGVNVCSFTVAVDRRFNKAGEERKADFINCVAWRQNAEFICKWFTKGRMIGLIGSIQTRDWTDNEGKKRYATEVIVDEAYFTESKGSSDGGASNAWQQNRAAGQMITAPQDFDSLPDGADFIPGESDDDLPF